MNQERQPLHDEHGTAGGGATALALYIELWRLLRPGIGRRIGGLTAAYLFSLGRIASSLSAPYFLAAVMDKALPGRDMDLLGWNTAAILSSVAAFFVFSFLMTFYMGQSLERIFLDLRVRLMSTALKKPTGFFSRYETGDLITRISNDTESLSTLVVDFIFPTLYHATLVVAFAATMLTWNWRLGLYTLLAVPCSVLLMSLYQKPLSRLARTARQRLSEQNETALDILSGVKEIRFYQQSLESSRRFTASAERYTEANIRSLLLGEWSFNTMELLGRMITLAPFLLGGYWICRGSSSISVGELIALQPLPDLSGRCTSPRDLRHGQAAPDCTAGEAHSGDSRSARGNDPSADGRGTCDGVDADRISWSLVQPHGQQAGAQGFQPSASRPGKRLPSWVPAERERARLIDLLIRQIEPDKGVILFDGRPLGSYKPSAVPAKLRLREAISLYFPNQRAREYRCRMVCRPIGRYRECSQARSHP